MEAKQAYSEASVWVASWFGQCSRVPPTEGELKFVDSEGKEKAGKDLQGPCSPAGASNVAIPRPGVEQKSDITTKRYLIDNSSLQGKRPGIAFRHCKEASKKVKEMSALWGEIVDGTDEGDGWLKVGSYFLPMVRDGKPIITLLEDRAVVDVGLNSEPLAPSVEEVSDHTSPPKAAVQKDVATSPKEDVIAEPEKPSASAAQESASSPKAFWRAFWTEPQTSSRPALAVSAC